MSDLISVKEAAPLINSSEATLRRLIKTNKIAFHKIRKRYLLSDEFIRQYLADTKVEPVPETAEYGDSENSPGSVKQNQPPTTANRILKIEREVTGREAPGVLTTAEAAECYRLLKEGYLAGFQV